MQKRLLYLGNVSSKIAFPIINTLSSVMLGLCNNFIKVFDQEEKTEKYGTHCFLHFFYMFTAESMSTFIYLIQEKISKRNLPKLKTQMIKSN